MENEKEPYTLLEYTKRLTQKELKTINPKITDKILWWVYKELNKPYQRPQMIAVEVLLGLSTSKARAFISSSETFEIKNATLVLQNKSLEKGTLEQLSLFKE